MREVKEMLECKICGTKFPALKERHYTSRDEGKTGLSAVLESNNEGKLYDTFDCPMCGCQVIAQGRKRTYRPLGKENEDD